MLHIVLQSLEPLQYARHANIIADQSKLVVKVRAMACDMRQSMIQIESSSTKSQLLSIVRLLG